ncbi:MAG: RpiB/LacA/LacB family sugar-phosphate isomerase, partial [Clostridiales bacterium]|nr:RpiB/LacA/LacB family sugar-phosphate isomerase [Clostridiales bacterium]
CTNEYMARMSRQHNDANVLSMGARVVGSSLALSIVDAYMTEPFDGGRHQTRVNDMKEQEKELFK